jgi:CHAT domain-containing protein/tetratricopeptide (TPR) repeat protein
MMRGAAASPSQVKERRLSSRAVRRIAYAVIAATILLVLGILFVKVQARDPVSKAYTERRTIETRFTGMGYAPYQKPPSRMGQEDDSNRTALNKALNNAVELCPQQGKADPRACQSKGRLLLLRDPKDWKRAVDAFEQSQSLGLNTPSLKIDLGVTYFEHAGFTDKRNFSQAINEFKSVLDGKVSSVGAEEREVALFNLALAYEQSASWDLAIDTWKQYPMHRPGAWADEARTHFADDQTRIPSPQLYVDSREFIRHGSDPEVRNDIEQHQEIALVRWLVNAVQDSASEDSHATRLVAAMLAESPHRDPLWQDLLHSTGKADQPAVQKLRDAFVANQNDLHEKALKDAGDAARLFDQRGNVPGALLAHFQEIYAQQRGLNAEDCLRAIDRLWPQVFATQYHWLQGQLALEKAVCANLAFNFEKVEPNFKISRDLAGKFGYPELRLRITGMEAGIQRMNFADDAAWRESVDGLKEYWQHPYSSERLLQFYSVMRQIANDLNYPHAAVVFLRRTIELLRQNAPEDRVLQALYHMRLANLYLTLNDEAQAEIEARLARELLKGSRTSYEALALIELADFHLRRGKPELALSVIQSLGRKLATQDQFVQLDLRRVRGDAELQLNRLEAAEQDYQGGIKLVESSFDRIQDEAKRREWTEIADKMFRGMVQILLARGKGNEALTRWEWSRSLILNRDFKAAGAGESPLPATSYPHLVYISFTDHLHVWLVRGSQATEKSIPVSRKDLLKRIHDFNRICGDPNSPVMEVEKQAKNLYQRLLQPVIGALDPLEPVAIEFDSKVLPPFSIEALRNPEGRYFGVDYAILHSPGIFAESALRPSEPLQSTASFLVIDASTAEGLGYLPGHEQLTTAITGNYSRAKLLRTGGLQPPKPADVDKAIKSSTALLVISHSRQNNDGIALELTPDFYFRAQNFSSEHPENLRVVVLAACSSGNAEKGALASDNLVRSLLVEKVPNVIASRWNVDSASTAELFQNFYANLKREPAAQALRDARRAWLLEHPDRAHPYFWAGFNLTGKSN